MKKIYPNQINFLCIIVCNAQACIEHFHKHNILTKNYNITIGTNAQNKKVIRAFKKFQ
ncbi:hypothetical protein CAXC1_200010 [Candidatus Xenohaliotis californiensis]|uniref:Uncharacterized protein n=1 Tax=Candidatus Xenohaliotis californiensis TaxID=84677 RepID=A0ABP0ESJ3_9RICK|nr:hypothetical protein CAXC1_200010 [Candidatus Xenohaliotis californiensis]